MIPACITVLILAVFAGLRHEWRRRGMVSLGALMVDALWWLARFTFCLAASADAWRLEWRAMRRRFAFERAERRVQ